MSVCKVVKKPRREHLPDSRYPPQGFVCTPEHESPAAAPRMMKPRPTTVKKTNFWRTVGHDPDPSSDVQVVRILPEPMVLMALTPARAPCMTKAGPRTREARHLQPRVLAKVKRKKPMVSKRPNKERDACKHTLRSVSTPSAKSG
jgi:hypothetical protein